MKYIYVLIDKETGKFWSNDSRNSRQRAIRAYTSEAKAWASVANALPHLDATKIEVRKFREISESLS